MGLATSLSWSLRGMKSTRLITHLCCLVYNRTVYDVNRHPVGSWIAQKISKCSVWPVCEKVQFYKQIQYTIIKVKKSVLQNNHQKTIMRVNCDLSLIGQKRSNIKTLKYSLQRLYNLVTGVHIHWCRNTIVVRIIWRDIISGSTCWYIRYVEGILFTPSKRACHVWG